MEEMNREYMDQLLQTVPGGIAKLAFDDMLTILYATDSFYALIKNVTDKINTKSPVTLLKMVYSADIISVTQQLASQKHRKDNMLNVHFRTLQHDGSFKWVMITGNRTEETYTFGSRTAPVYSCIAMDITSFMVNYKKLEQVNDYHNKITELSKELYFEYEIATDTLHFTELFHEIFGKESELPRFRSRLENTKLIHQEELPAIVAIYNSMMSGRKQARFEVRLIPKDGNPVWYICYASIIFDENRNPFKVVGKLSAKNIFTKEPEKPEYIPQMDSLTNVCTKEATEVLISEAAEKQDSASLSALLLIDIRNYKNFNEIQRFITGDNVLTGIGRILKNQFRATDVVGRIGLNEFAVYMKNIQTDKAAYDAAEKLCREIDTIYSYEHTKNVIYASIGIAFHKGEQKYQELMANANTALVMAKKVPSSSFEVFSGAIN